MIRADEMVARLREAAKPKTYRRATRTARTPTDEALLNEAADALTALSSERDLLRRELERLQDALDWMENDDPQLVAQIRERAALDTGVTGG